MGEAGRRRRGLRPGQRGRERDHDEHRRGETGGARVRLAHRDPAGQPTRGQHEEPGIEPPVQRQRAVQRSCVVLRMAAADAPAVGQAPRHHAGRAGERDDERRGCGHVRASKETDEATKFPRVYRYLARLSFLLDNALAQNLPRAGT